MLGNFNSWPVGISESDSCNEQFIDNNIDIKCRMHTCEIVTTLGQPQVLVNHNQMLSCSPPLCNLKMINGENDRHLYYLSMQLIKVSDRLSSCILNTQMVSALMSHSGAMGSNPLPSNIFLFLSLSFLSMSHELYFDSTEIMFRNFCNTY